MNREIIQIQKYTPRWKLFNYFLYACGQCYTVTACQSWSHCCLSNGHFYFQAKNPSPDIFLGPNYIHYMYLYVIYIHTTYRVQVYMQYVYPYVCMWYMCLYVFNHVLFYKFKINIHYEMYTHVIRTPVSLEHIDGVLSFFTTRHHKTNETTHDGGSGKHPPNDSTNSNKKMGQSYRFLRSQYHKG